MTYWAPGNSNSQLQLTLQRDRQHTDIPSKRLGGEFACSLTPNVSALLPSLLCLRALAFTAAKKTGRAGIYRRVSKLNAAATVQHM